MTRTPEQLLRVSTGDMNTDEVVELAAVLVAELPEENLNDLAVAMHEAGVDIDRLAQEISTRRW